MMASQHLSVEPSSLGTRGVSPLPRAPVISLGIVASPRRGAVGELGYICP